MAQHIANASLSATVCQNDTIPLAAERKTDPASVTAERDAMLANGYQPMPVRERAKGGNGALMKGWPQTRGRIPFNPRWTGTGILPLEKVGCIDVDIDHDDYATAAGVREIAFRHFRQTPCEQTRANSARIKLLYQNLPDEEGVYPRSTKVLMPTPPGEKNRAVEYRTSLQYFGVFLVHESGVPFEWKSGSPLIIKREWLPGVTAEKLAAFLAEVAERFPRPDRQKVHVSGGIGPKGSGKKVSPFADMSSTYQPVWPADAAAFLRDVPNTAALVPSYDEYYRIPQACHAALRDYRATLVAQGIAAGNVNAIIAKEEAALLEAWCFFASQQPQDEKSSPERKWEDTRNIYDEKNASLIITLAQQAGYWLPSRRPKPVQIVNAATGVTVTLNAVAAKDAADQLFKAAKETFLRYRSARSGMAQMLGVLVDADPAVARLAIGKVVFFLIGRFKAKRMPLELVADRLSVITNVAGCILGAESGARLTSKALCEFYPPRAG